MQPFQRAVLVNRIQWNLILLKIKICLSVSWMVDLFQTTASSFIYLIIPSHVCTCERTDHGALGPAGHLTPHPWPPSAGQTLTLEQMDNGLHALSAPDHTLLSPALATAFPFTSCCPLFLFLHLPCPPLDCLNSQKHLCYTFYVFSFSTILRLNSTPLPLISYISCILCIYFYLLRFLSLSILFQAGASSYSLFVSTDFVLWEFSSAVNQQIAFFIIILHPVTPFNKMVRLC